MLLGVLSLCLPFATHISSGDTIVPCSHDGSRQTSAGLCATRYFLRGASTADRAAYMLGMGYVAQTPYLAPGTLAQNVAFSQWGRPYDEKQVLNACQLAHLDIVNQRPEGINLLIGEGGSGLSGGQEQRLSIACALYASPNLLILDEATRSLDPGIEAAIMNTIAALPNSMTLAIMRTGFLLWSGVTLFSGSRMVKLPCMGRHQRFCRTIRNTWSGFHANRFRRRNIHRI